MVQKHRQKIIQQTTLMIRSAIQSIYTDRCSTFSILPSRRRLCRLRGLQSRKRWETEEKCTLQPSHRNRRGQSSRLTASTAAPWRGKWSFWSDIQGSIPRGMGPVCRMGQLSSSKFTSWGYPAASTTNSHCLFISLKTPVLTFTSSHVSDFLFFLKRVSETYHLKLWNFSHKKDKKSVFFLLKATF